MPVLTAGSFGQEKFDSQRRTAARRSRAPALQDSTLESGFAERLLQKKSTTSQVAANAGHPISRSG
jgi:hypothetical protein